MSVLERVRGVKNQVGRSPLVISTASVVWLAQFSHLDAELSWKQVEHQVAEHRRLVRMCGPLSAARALCLLGHDVDLGVWLNRFESETSRGVSIRTVLSLCQEYEPQAVAVRTAGASVWGLSFPCVLLVNDARHCLVAQSLSVDGIRLWDPSDLREKTLPVTQLRSIWNGEAILLRPRDRLGVGRMVSIGLWFAAAIAIAYGMLLCRR